MDTLLVVDIIDRSCPKFKKHPFKSIEEDPLGAFSSILYGVLHVEDIREYIHENIDELGSSQLSNLFMNHLRDEGYNLKAEYKVLELKNFIQFIKILLF